MYLRSLYLQQFRNYGEGYFEFNPSINLICGPNAQGKTSLLEAIHYLMIGRSFRLCVHQDVIQIGSPFFYLEAIFCKHGVDQKIRLQTDGKERKIFCNSTSLPNISNLLGLIPGVIMTPDDVNLIKGPPLTRRQFLDIQIAQSDPLYVHYLSRYTKAMRQRNELLKQKKMLTIESWEYEMAQAAAYIIMQRRLAINILQLHSQNFYTYLTDEKESLAIEYRSGASTCQSEIEVKEFYQHQFAKQREKEMFMGYTLSGPHKDDMWIGIGGKDIRYFASEGQQRSCVAALHMGEWQRLKQLSGTHPLLMIDDVGISLDQKRRERLLDQLSSMGQVFLTTTEVSLLNSYRGEKKIFHLPFSNSSSPCTLVQYELN